MLLGGGVIVLQTPSHAQRPSPRVGVLLLLGGAAAAANLKVASELARLGYVETAFSPIKAHV
jgi:hypothetical protein